MMEIAAFDLRGAEQLAEWGVSDSVEGRKSNRRSLPFAALRIGMTVHSLRMTDPS